MSRPQHDATLITLHGRETSLILEIHPNGAPLWRYWGQRLADDFNCGLPLLETRESPSFSLNEPIPFSLFPTFGLGWFGQSALLSHRAGADFAQGFDGCEVKRDGDALIVKLTDGVTKIAVTLSIHLDAASDVLTMSTALKNESDAPLSLQWLAAATLPLPDNAAQVHSFTGRHNGEFQPQAEALGRTIWRKENRHGLTSHEAFPGAVVMAGEVAYGAQLAWSGNSVQQIEWLDDGRYQWQLGEWLSPGEITLAPGERFQSPDVIATCSPAGRDGVAANFHASMRKRLDWPGGEMKPRPVILNTWEGYWFTHDQAALMRLADHAAEIGVERFVLDDGWFKGRDDDTTSLGDWTVDARKYPAGLGPLASHVTNHGMEFGLWVEPEMINPDSDLFRAHPDWALQIAGRPLAMARNQLVLDLARNEVSDYLFERIGALLSDLPISYLKWDHNRDLTAAGGADGQARYHAQVQAAYDLFARFRSAFPHVEIEGCAGGGGRIDAGIIRHTHRFWTSDCTDARSRVEMQRGFLQFMPPEVMGSHVAYVPNHATGRTQSLDFRAAVACQGHFGVELDVVTMDAEERARLAQWIGFYKQWRHLLHAEIWRGEAADNLVWHAAGNANEWLCFVYRMEPMGLRHMPPLRLPFVAKGQFEVRQIAPGHSGDVMQFDSSWIAQHGLPVPHMKAEAAIIFHGKRI